MRHAELARNGGERRAETSEEHGTRYFDFGQKSRTRKHTRPRFGALRNLGGGTSGADRTLESD